MEKADGLLVLVVVLLLLLPCAPLMRELEDWLEGRQEEDELLLEEPGWDGLREGWDEPEARGVDDEGGVAADEGMVVDEEELNEWRMTAGCIAVVVDSVGAGGLVTVEGVCDTEPTS